jgi:undecaprenyl diphosphate synthase
MAFPSHIAIIMDGNGRWAKERGLPRVAGHRAGVEAVRATVRAARRAGVEYLTLYAFSSENWSRPASEVNDLMGLLRTFIRRDLAELHRENVRIRIIGDKTTVEPSIKALLDEAENLTRENTAQQLVIAFNYGSRDEITRMVRTIAARVAGGDLDLDAIDGTLVANTLDTSGIPDPDLLIRTSGEKRLSNFLLWQCAYTEFVFPDCYWPEFGETELKLAIAEFENRERRFGGIIAKDVAS